MSFATVNEPVVAWTCDACAYTEQVVGPNTSRPVGWVGLNMHGTPMRRLHVLDFCAPCRERTTVAEMIEMCLARERD